MGKKARRVAFFVVRRKYFTNPSQKIHKSFIYGCVSVRRCEMKRIMKNLTLKMKAVLLFALAAIVLAATGFALLFGRSGEKLSLTASAEEAQLDEYVDSDIYQYVDWSSLEFQESYGELADQVYPSTTLWDIKTRLKVTATLLTGETGSVSVTRELKPNEFNISINLERGDHPVWYDRDVALEDGSIVKGAPSDKPFEDWEKETLTDGSRLTVTVIPLKEFPSSTGMTDSSNQNKYQIQVDFHKDDPIFESGTLEAEFKGDFVYTNTGLRTYNIYSFDYRANITARLQGKEDKVEIPRELLTLQQDSSFQIGGNNSVDITLDYPDNSGEKDYVTQKTTILYISCTTPSPKAIRIAVNAGPEHDKNYHPEEAIDGHVATTVYPVPSTTSGTDIVTYYRKVGAEIPWAHDPNHPENQYGSNKQHYASTVEHKYYAFVVGEDNYVLQFALVARVYDNNGGVTEMLGTDPQLSAVVVPSTTDEITYEPIQLMFMPSDGFMAPLLSNQIKVRFVKAAESFLETKYLQSVNIYCGRNDRKD